MITLSAATCVGAKATLMSRDDRAGRSLVASDFSASARSFSSFILLVGKISSPTSFEPVSAVIVKDRDEVLSLLVELLAQSQG